MTDEQMVEEIRIIGELAVGYGGEINWDDIDKQKILDIIRKHGYIKPVVDRQALYDKLYDITCYELRGCNLDDFAEAIENGEVWRDE